MWRRCCWATRAESRVHSWRENVFDAQLEQRGDGEGERQAGVVAAILDGIDRLARDIERLGQLSLRHAARFAQLFDLVLHGASTITPVRKQSADHPQHGHDGPDGERREPGRACGLGESPCEEPERGYAE